MYHPYIRGKQFELIGIRELADSLLASNSLKIAPIIEPVRDSSTLKTTLDSLVSNNINFTLIVNPLVGTFKDPERIFEVVRQSVGDSINFQIGVIFHKDSNHEKAIEVLSNNNDIIPAISIIHNEAFENVNSILERYEDLFEIKYNIINIKEIRRKRYYRNFDKKTCIELDDYFISQDRNSDYLKLGESNFSEEHLFYKEDGYVGFSDFLSIGDQYSETGFLPYAVAIHLSYANDSGVIKIKHFVSDSNDDPSDVAGKFAEALDKLIEWCNDTNYTSIAVEQYREYHRKGHFPGLGTLKKLSLMNHIELVLNLI